MLMLLSCFCKGSTNVIVKASSGSIRNGFSPFWPLSCVSILKGVETNSKEELRALILERVTRATLGFMYREDYCLLSSHCYLQFRGFFKSLATAIAANLGKTLKYATLKHLNTP